MQGEEERWRAMCVALIRAINGTFAISWPPSFLLIIDGAAINRWNFRKKDFFLGDKFVFLENRCVCYDICNDLTGEEKMISFFETRGNESGYDSGVFLDLV